MAEELSIHYRTQYKNGVTVTYYCVRKVCHRIARKLGTYMQWRQSKLLN